MTRDSVLIKLLIGIGYIIGYPLAVLPPIIIDPKLTTHYLFPSQHYPFAWLSFVVYLFVIYISIFVFRLNDDNENFIALLFRSVLFYMASIIFTIPIFYPVIPHLNVVIVGIFTTCLSATSIFLYSITGQLIDKLRKITRKDKFSADYFKELLAFGKHSITVLVAAFFGAILIGWIKVGGQFNTRVAKSAHDVLLLDLNMSIQIIYFSIYIVFGPLRIAVCFVFKVLSYYYDLIQKL